MTRAINRRPPSTPATMATVEKLEEARDFVSAGLLAGADVGSLCVEDKVLDIEGEAPDEGDAKLTLLFEPKRPVDVTVA